MDFNLNLAPVEIPEHLPKMKEMYEDLFGGGKHYRGHLVYQVAQELELDQESSLNLARAIESIHNSSLLHDDILDQAHLRRGKTTAWKKYGSSYAVLSGDYLLAKVIFDLSKEDSLPLISYTSQSILRLVEGEWLQDACHNRTDVTAEEMQAVHIAKSAALFSWCFKAPALLKKEIDEQQEKTLFKVGELIGLLLQRSDDLLDFNIRNFEGKEFYNDVQAGYFNSFMIYLLKDQTEEFKNKVFEIKRFEDFQALDLHLESALKEYDQESQSLLDELQELLASLDCLSEEFKKDIFNAADSIYWRK